MPNQMPELEPRISWLVRRVQRASKVTRRGSESFPKIGENLASKEKNQDEQENDKVGRLE
jgi:hypothetical protein